MSLRDAGRARALLALAALGGTALMGTALILFDLNPTTVLGLVVAGIGLPFLVLRPDIGVHLFIVTLYFENLVFTEQGFTGMKLVGGLILAGWMVNVGVKRKINLPGSPVITLMLLFVAWLAVSAVYAIDADVAFGRVLTFAQLGVVMCMFGSVVDTPVRVRGIYRAIVLWTTLAAAHGVALYYMGLRPNSAGLVLNRNLMATYIDLAIVCAYILFQMSPNPMERLALTFALPILFLGLALTFSRTGYITIVVVFALVSYRLAKTRGYLVLGASATMFILLSTFLPEAFYARVATIIPSMQHQEDTFGLRVALWKAGMRMIREHPVVGVGPANFIIAVARYGQGLPADKHQLVSHNSYVGTAAEGGIPALAIYLFLCIAALREAWMGARALKRGPPLVGLEAVGVELCIVVILIAGLSGDAERLKYLYVFFGLAISLGRMARQAALPSVPPGAALQAGDPRQLSPRQGGLIGVS